MRLVRRDLLVSTCGSVTLQPNSELDRKVDPLGTSNWLPRMSIAVVIVGNEPESPQHTLLFVHSRQDRPIALLLNTGATFMAYSWSREDWSQRPRQGWWCWCWWWLVSYHELSLQKLNSIMILMMMRLLGTMNTRARGWGCRMIAISLSVLAPR